MKNDLDFVKEKIEQSGVNAPSDMDESFVLSRLEGVEPKSAGEAARAAESPKPKLGWKPIAAIAAAVVIVAALGVAIGSMFIGKPKMIALPGGLSLYQFRNSGEIREAVKNIKDARAKMDVGDYIDEFGELIGGFDYNYAVDEAVSDSTSRKSASGSEAGGSGSSHSETYKQVEGVDEADIVKTDGRYIYCVDNSTFEPKIAIFSAEGESSRKVAEINADTAFRATPDEAGKRYNADRTYINEIYVRGDRLIALCGCEGGIYSVGYEDGIYSADQTCAAVYDIGDIGDIALLDSITQSGSYRSSRMIGDRLYTVTSYYAYSEDDYVPACGRGATPEEVPADCVYCLANPESESFLVVSAYDTLDYTALTESKAILGSVDDIYCTQNNMYIYSTVYDYGDGERWYDDIFGISRDGGSSGRSTVKSQIMKVSLTDGIGFAAYAGIDGRIDDQYALDEKDGMLRVATTSRVSGKAINCLYIMDGELGMLGRTEGFAQGEEIKAVRYVGDTAYVITYEQTDPLFVIDLSDPSNPDILGAAEITGFSTMLVPIDENTVLGLGYHEEQYNSDGEWAPESGFKLALFDVSDKADPKVLDSKAYVDYSSDVMYNPKALVYNPERGDYIVPLNYYSYIGPGGSDVYDYGTGGDNAKASEPGHYECKGGALNFKVENGKLVEIAVYESGADTVDRCVYVGDTVYMTYYDYTEGGELRISAAPYGG